MRMQLPPSDAMTRTSLRDAFAPPAGLPGSAIAAESFRGALYEPCALCPSPDTQSRANDIAPDQSASGSTAGEETESREEPDPLQNQESTIAGTAVIVPTVVNNDVSSPAQAADGSDEHMPTGVDAEVRAVRPVTSGAAANVQLPADTLTNSAVKPSDEQTAGPTDGQAIPAIRSSRTGTQEHDSEEIALREKHGDVVTKAMRDAPSEAIERAAEGREHTPPWQKVTEITVATAKNLESARMEVENAGFADTGAPRAVTSESAALPPSSWTASEPHWLASRLPRELLSTWSSQAAVETRGLEIDSARLIQRVARAFAATHDGSGEVRLRLSPPELGALRLDVKVEGAAIVAHIEAETAAARSVLIENLPALRERLAEQGVRIERFDVDLMKRGDERAFDRPANQAPKEHTAQLPLQPRERRLPQVADGVVVRTTILGDLDQRRLNVLV